MTKSVLWWAGVFALAFPALCLAQTPMSGEAFEEAAEGRVFDVFVDGVLVQREAFFADRRVRLGFPPEGHDPMSLAPIPCVEGRWQPANDAICFVYERPDGTTDGPHCWSITALSEGRQRAQSLSPGVDLQLELGVSEVPLICRGPEVGV